MSENEGTFRNKILRLIDLQQEGPYWDFKREWHEKNSDLLLDIICMANNLNNSDAYIIIGVDEENGYSINDVQNDPNRRNTQQLVDFLKDKKFAGEVRPVVHVEHLKVSIAILDVLVVHNSHQTPYYLIEQYQGVRAYHIYTRIMDTNTPRDKSADIYYVEQLWRKRFHLNETPLERMSYYLSMPDDWVVSPFNADERKYYKYAPEFTIKKEYDPSRTGYEYYHFKQIDSHPSWYDVTLYYQQTALIQFSGISLDGGRCFAIAPATSGIVFTNHYNWDLSYKYFEKNTIDYALLMFYFKEESADQWAAKRFADCFLFFESSFERKRFVEYVIANEKTYRELFSNFDDYALPNVPKSLGKNAERYIEDYKNACVLRSMLEMYRTMQRRREKELYE